MNDATRRRGSLWISWTILLVLTSGTAALGQSDQPEWEPITEERLLNPEDGDWHYYRRTYDVTGFSPLDEINQTNVNDLRLVWAYSMRDNSRWVPTPIVANGLMYVCLLYTSPSPRDRG